MKCGPASMINHEWKAAMKIRQLIGNDCPFLVWPIDRNPLDGFLVTNNNRESDSDDSDDSTV
jgi:nicotinamide riboside kinase